MAITKLVFIKLLQCAGYSLDPFKPNVEFSVTSDGDVGNGSARTMGAFGLSFLEHEFQII